MSQPIHFSGHQHLRSRLVLSILSGKHIRIDKIRSEDKNPGLQGVMNLQLKERHFLQRILQIMRSVFCDYLKKWRTVPSLRSRWQVRQLAFALVKREVNKFTSLVHVGTAILLRPGIILGGTLQHDCPTSRSIGYFLEPIVRLAPFAKKPMHLTLKGITTDEHDFSVTSVLIVTLQYLSKCLQLGRYFADSDSPSLAVVWHFWWIGTQGNYHNTDGEWPVHLMYLKIKRRGASPGGGGEVQFLCPIVKQVKTLNFVDPGKIKRIRGIAWVLLTRNVSFAKTHPCSHAVRVSPQFSNRMIEASRSILNRYIPDIYLYSDVYKGDESGKWVIFVPSAFLRILVTMQHV